MSQTIRFVLLALALAFASAGCKAQIRGSATVTQPELVLIEGDVWVVERYNEPVFYTEGFYWRWHAGVWHRSTVHTGNWVRVDVVPVTVQRIEKPEIYVNYVATAGAQKRTGPPDHAPAHGVRGTEPGHAPGGPPGHDKDKGPPAGGPPAGGPPGHDKGAMGTPPGQDKGMGGGPAGKPDKPVGGPDKAKDPGPPAKDAAKPDKGPPAAKEEKKAAAPAKEDKKPAAKEEKAPAAKEEKAAPAKEEKGPKKK